MRPIFPRFYNYDVLRGLSWVIRWSEMTKTPLRKADLEEMVSGIDSLLDDDGSLSPSNDWTKNTTTLSLDETRVWRTGKPAQRFHLLDWVVRPDIPSFYLTQEWYDTISELDRLTREGLLIR